MRIYHLVTRHQAKTSTSMGLAGKSPFADRPKSVPQVDPDLTEPTEQNGLL